jgi:hypothetical protein
LGLRENLGQFALLSGLIVAARIYETRSTA